MKMKELLKWINETNPTVNHITDKIKLIISEEKPAKKFVAPDLMQVIEYFVDNGYIAEVGKKAFNYYNAANWKDSKGKAIINWKQKMVGVWFKDENKIKKPQRLGYPVMSDYYSYDDFEKAVDRYKKQNNLT